MKGKSDNWVDEWESYLKESLELEDLAAREKAMVATVHHVRISLPRFYSTCPPASNVSPFLPQDLFRTAHPREEHYLPLAVIVGAGGKAKRVHHFSGGNFAVSQYEFDVISEDGKTAE